MNYTIIQADLEPAPSAEADAFSANLLSLINGFKLTQKAFAQSVGVSESSVVKWLNGTIPGGQNLTRVAKLFKVTPEALLTYTHS